MRIIQINDTLIGELEYLNASPWGEVVRESLPVVQGTVRGLPAGLDGIVATADLQGRERAGQAPGRLLGEAVAEQLGVLWDHAGLPQPVRLGVLLAGDFYAGPDLSRRGGHGDVAEVWRAFGVQFRWVAGVLGNHDNPADTGPCANTHLLDGTVLNLDGLRIGGVSGTMGKPSRNNRKTVAAFRRMLEGVLLDNADMVVLHEAPSHAETPARGNDLLRDWLEYWAQLCAESGRVPPLIVCGHRHWPVPVVELSHGLQVLNVNARVVVLLRE